jgi:hypothetical protein
VLKDDTHYFGISSDGEVSQRQKIQLWGMCQTLIYSFFGTTQESKPQQYGQMMSIKS